MKKIFASVTLSFILLINFSYAATTSDDYKRQGKCQVYVKDTVASLFPTSFCSAGDLITAVIKIMLAFISMVAAVVIILAGYKYVTSQGNQEAATGARKSLTNAVIGLVVAILAYSIVSIVSNTISTENGPAAPPAANGGNLPGSTDTSGSDAQQALINKLVDSTQIYGADLRTPDGTAYTSITVEARITAADIASICSDTSGKANALVSVNIPFKDGKVKNYRSNGYQFTAANGADLKMDISSQYDPFPTDVIPPIDDKADLTFTITITFDKCSTLKYNVVRKAGSIAGI